MATPDLSLLDAIIKIKDLVLSRRILVLGLALGLLLLFAPWAFPASFHLWIEKESGWIALGAWGCGLGLLTYIGEWAWRATAKARRDSNNLKALSKRLRELPGGEKQILAELVRRNQSTATLEFTDTSVQRLLEKQILSLSGSDGARGVGVYHVRNDVWDYIREHPDVLD